MLRSLAEDGEFARHVYMHRETWLPGILCRGRRCRREAERACARDLAGWFAHSLPFMVPAFADEPGLNFRVRRKALIEQCVWFLLRGMASSRARSNEIMTRRLRRFR